MITNNAYLYQDYARFYDWTYEGHVADLQFYINLATKFNSPVLELACGTGRLTIPLRIRDLLLLESISLMKCYLLQKLNWIGNR